MVIDHIIDNKEKLCFKEIKYTTAVNLGLSRNFYWVINNFPHPHKHPFPSFLSEKKVNGTHNAIRYFSKASLLFTPVDRDRYPKVVKACLFQK